MFWLVVVLVGIAISSFVIYGLIQKYYRFEIYTEVKKIFVANLLRNVSKSMGDLGRDYRQGHADFFQE